MAQEEFGEVLGTTKDEILHNKLEEMKYMKGKCEACGSGFSYDGRKHRTAPEKCSGCGGPPGSIPLKFDPPPEQEINVSAKKREKPDPAEDPRHAPEDYRPPIELIKSELTTRSAAVDAIRADQDAIFQSRDGTRGTHRLNTLTCAVIIGDKAERLINQWKNDMPLDPEEWLDIANYAIIALLLERGQWQLPWRDGEEAA